MKKILTLLVVLSVLSTAFVFSGCSSDDGGKKEVKLGAVNWAEGIAMTNLAKAVLEEKMDYSVEITVADVGPIFTALSNGDQDAFMDTWLPVTHKDKIAGMEDSIVDLGYNFEGAKIGLVVPSYVEIDSIEEMNDYKDKFNGEIIGIDAGAGIMAATETAIADYGLDIELVTSSGPMMTASLKKAIDAGEWVAVTGWKPHWKFARWDLKFLEDPKGIYGAVENIHTYARKDLEEDMPEVAEFLTNFKMNDQQLGSLMGDIADSDKDPFEVAKEWMNANEDLVNSWLPAE